MTNFKKLTLRRLKILITVGIIGCCVTMGLVLWAGISAFNYIANKTTDVVQSQKTTFQDVNVESCLGTAQSLVALGPWLHQPPMDNFKSLKAACLDKETLNDSETTEGGTT